MGVVDQTNLFWDTAIEVAKRSGVDEVTLSPYSRRDTSTKTMKALLLSKR